MLETEKLAPAKAPCKSCPYRRDVPSGLWAAEEYDKLPRYDGEIIAQLAAGGTAVFMCHQQDGRLCAGWLAAHGPDNLLALRLRGADVATAAWRYVSPVPVFASGFEAAAHGKAQIERPGTAAQRAIQRLARKLASASGEAS